MYCLYNLKIICFLEEPETPVSLPNEVRSILSHGRRKGKKKSVQWVEEENIKEIFYFEMDETERGSVFVTIICIVNKFTNYF